MKNSHFDRTLRYRHEKDRIVRASFTCSSIEKPYKLQDREAGLFDWPKTLECTADEGVNVVRFDWVGNQHGAVKNTDHWMMSCFGLGNKCSEECEGTFIRYRIHRNPYSMG